MDTVNDITDISHKTRPHKAAIIISALAILFLIGTYTYKYVFTDSKPASKTALTAQADTVTFFLKDMARLKVIVQYKPGADYRAKAEIQHELRTAFLSITAAQYLEHLNDMPQFINQQMSTKYPLSLDYISIPKQINQ